MIGSDWNIGNGTFGGSASYNTSGRWNLGVGYQRAAGNGLVSIGPSVGFGKGGLSFAVDAGYQFLTQAKDANGRPLFRESRPWMVSTGGVSGSIGYGPGGWSTGLGTSYYPEKLHIDPQTGLPTWPGGATTNPLTAALAAPSIALGNAVRPLYMADLGGARQAVGQTVPSGQVWKEAQEQHDGFWITEWRKLVSNTKTVAQIYDAKVRWYEERGITVVPDPPSPFISRLMKEFANLSPRAFVVVPAYDPDAPGLHAMTAEQRASSELYARFANAGMEEGMINIAARERAYAARREYWDREGFAWWVKPLDAWFNPAYEEQGLVTGNSVLLGLAGFSTPLSSPRPSLGPVEGQRIETVVTPNRDFVPQFAPPQSGGRAAVSLGQMGEMVASRLIVLAKNTGRIPSMSGEAKYRIPDFMEPLSKHELAESKNVDYQGLTCQLRDDRAFVLRSGYPGRVSVLIDRRTEITLPLLRAHLNPGDPIKVIVAPLSGLGAGGFSIARR